jgi:hypothetical protein
VKRWGSGLSALTLNVINPGREKARFKLGWLFVTSNLVALSAPFWQITKINCDGAGVVGESGAVLAIVHFSKKFWLQCNDCRLLMLSLF